jgi:FixJ family two-component response regulator
MLSSGAIVPHPTSNVFVVDDDESMRAAIESLLRSVGLHVRTFATPADFQGRKPTDGPACLVLDVRLPGTSGLELQRALLQIEPGLPVVFITAHADIATSVRAMKAGAIEFLPKPFRDEELLEAVRAGLEISSLSLHTRSRLSELRRRQDSLTPRERQVLELVVSGLLNKQIAFELGISEVTVKIHRAQVMQKMQARSIADLVRMADCVTPPNGRPTVNTKV